MRPLDVSLVLVDLVTLGVLAVPPLCAVRWTGSLPAVAVLIAVAQMISEGPRWQIVPADVLTGLFFLVWLMRRARPAGRPVNRLAAGLAIGLATLALLISAALPIGIPVFRFPRPGGPYAIGTVTYDWVDATRPEVFTADPNDHRELIVQVWYPARASGSSPRVPYVPNSAALAPGLARLAEQNADRLFPGSSRSVPRFPFTHLKYISTNAVAAAPVAPDQSSYPVLIFLEGLNGLRQMNTFQVEELVSHGYIVAAVDQPYTAAEVVFSDGRQVGGLSKDQLNALLQQSLSPVTKAPIMNGQTTMRAVFESLPGNGYFVQLPGMLHLNPTDVPLLIYPPLGKTVGLFGPVHADRVHRIVNTYSLAFFDRHLKGMPAQLLDAPAASDPEVKFDTHRPEGSGQHE